MFHVSGLEHVHLLPVQREVLQEAEGDGRDGLHEARPAHARPQQEPRQPVPAQGQDQHLRLEPRDHADHHRTRGQLQHPRHVQGQRQVGFVILHYTKININILNRMYLTNSVGRNNP